VVVGANPTRRLRELAARDPSIEVTGRVDDVRPFLWRAAVSVAPLHIARGLQNKVLEALAAGLPVVVTSAARSGLPAGVERGCVTADAPAAFAGAVMEALGLPAAERRAHIARSEVPGLEWGAQLAPLRGLLMDRSEGQARKAEKGRR
jgi:glycosyltransferase involved in cell wall biosynthesis